MKGLWKFKYQGMRTENIIYRTFNQQLWKLSNPCFHNQHDVHTVTCIELSCVDCTKVEYLRITLDSAHCCVHTCQHGTTVIDLVNMCIPVCCVSFIQNRAEHSCGCRFSTSTTLIMYATTQHFNHCKAAFFDHKPLPLDARMMLGTCRQVLSLTVSDKNVCTFVFVAIFTISCFC